MRKIERSNAFKKDYKRLLKGNYQSVLGEYLVAVLKLLVADKPLDEKYRDHELIGKVTGNVMSNLIYY